MTLYAYRQAFWANLYVWSSQHLVTSHFIFRFTHGIGYSTMDRKKLDKLTRELASLRNGRHKALAFQSLAKKLGRKENSKRGKEPMWESEQFGDLFPLAIPDHGGRDISPGVQRQLLNLLEEDVLRWEELIEAEEQNEEADEDDGPGEDYETR
jgi:hypothetical protein